MKFKSTSIELLNDFFDDLNRKGFQFPDFTNEKEIIIFSDYSGDRTEDNYYAYAYYIVDSSAMLDAAGHIMAFRHKNPGLRDTSFIEYKKLNRSPLRQKLLPHFLGIFDQIKGLVITILVDKKAPDYFFKVNDEQAKKIYELGGGQWKPEILRKQSNIFSLLAFLVKRFLDSRATFTWYSDRDPIFGSNQITKALTLELLSKFLAAYEVNMNGLQYRFISDNGTPLNSDFLAISDLAAGSILEYYQYGYQNQNLKETTKTVIGWMANNNMPLKKLMMIGGEENNNKKLTTLDNYGRQTPRGCF